MDPRRVPFRVDTAFRIAVLALAGFYLAPMLRIGYISDDAVRSLLPGVLKVEGYTLPEYIAAECMGFLRASRVFPIQIAEMCSWFIVAQEPRAHRMMAIAGVLLDLWLFALLVRRVGRSAPFSLFATCLLIPLFQFRAAFDPVLAFFGIFQVTVAGLLASLLALQVYLDTDKKRYLVASILTYVVALGMYEVVYPAFLLHCTLISLDRRTWRSRLSASFPFAALSAIGVLSTMVARHVFLYNEALQGQSRVSLDPTAFVVTLARQTWSAFPMSYYLIRHTKLCPSLKHVAPLLRFMATPGGLAIFGATLALCLASFRRTRVDTGGQASGRMGRVALLGALLGIIPALLISISARHQRMIEPGIGYTPVYLQYFGVAMFLAASAWSLLAAVPAGYRRLAAQAAVGLVVATTAGLTYRANSVLMDKMEIPLGAPGFNPVVGNVFAQWNYHRRNLESALRAGLLDGVREHSDIHLANEYPGWHNRMHSQYFYAMYGGKVVNTIVEGSGPVSEQNFFVPKDSLRGPRVPAAQSPSYTLRDVCLGKDAGYVLLSPDGSPGSPRPASEDGPTHLYVRHPILRRAGGVRDLMLIGRSTTEGPGGTGLRRILRGRELQVLRSGPDWAMLSLSGKMAGIDPETLVAVFDPVSGSWDEKTYSPRIRRAQAWERDDRKVLCLSNATDGPRKVRISMLLKSNGNESVVLDAGTSRTQADAGPQPTRIERELTLAPGVSLLEIRAPEATHPPAAEGPRRPYFFASSLKVQDLSVTRR